MDIPSSRAAACRPDIKIDPVDKYRYPVEPADPGPIHAWLHSADPGPPVDWRDNRKDVERLSGWIFAQRGTACLEDGEFVRAACGRRIRVIYQRPFDTADTGACPACVSMATLWQMDPHEYDRQVKARNETWAQRDDERLDRQYYADIERERSYGTDPIEDEDE